MEDNIKLEFINYNEISSISEDEMTKFSNIKFRENLSEKHKFLLAKRENGELVGVAKIYQDPAHNNIHIDFVEVSSDARGEGIGTLMVKKVVDMAKTNSKVITGDGFIGDKAVLRILKKIIGTDSNMYQTIGRA